MLKGVVMEHINVINGNGNVSREKINVLLDAAIGFYGSKYEPIILDVVRNSLIYERNPYENIKKAISNISEKRVKPYHKMPKACSLTLKVLDNVPLNAIIWKPEHHDQDYAILAHELYGHAVCGMKKLIVGGTFKRNGISLYNIQTEKSRLELLNEGFMEFIAKSIVERTSKNITQSYSKKYDLARRCAEYIWKILGKDLVLDDLVEYHGMIEKEYNKNCDTHSLVLLDRLLQCNAATLEIFPFGAKKVSKSIKKELVEFRKRKISKVLNKK